MKTLDFIPNGETSVILRIMLYREDTGEGITGLSNLSSGLIISTIGENEATATSYTQAGSTIETITTLGTYSAPTASNCRFDEVDATNHPGLYEIQLADARYAISSNRYLDVTVSGATNLLTESGRISHTIMDVNVFRVNDVTITGAGTEGDPFGP